MKIKTAKQMERHLKGMANHYRLLMIYLACGLPFFFGGSAITIAISRFAGDISRVQGADGCQGQDCWNGHSANIEFRFHGLIGLLQAEAWREVHQNFPQQEIEPCSSEQRKRCLSQQA